MEQNKVCTALKETLLKKKNKESVLQSLIEKEIPLTFPREIKKIYEVEDKKFLIVFQAQNESHKYASLELGDDGSLTINYRINFKPNLNAEDLLKNKNIQLFLSFFQAKLEASGNISITKCSKNELLVQIPVKDMKKTNEIAWLCNGAWLIAIGGNDKNQIVLWKIDTEHKIFSKKWISES